MTRKMSQYTSDERAQHIKEHGQNSDAPVQDLEDAIQIERDKKLIKNHPLFVLLEMLFEKCEQATQGDEAPTSSAFDEELQEFVRQRQYEMTPILTNDSEIDNLMIKAIQVLRIHLLELEKVNELCKDFCHRYITCLKGKMHSENLLRSDSGIFADAQTSVHGQLANTPNANVTVNLQGEIVLQGGYQSGVSSSSDGHSNENIVNGSTPLSQVGVNAPPPAPQVIPPHMYHLPHNNIEDGNNRKSKRGVLPKQATEILRSWLFSHIVHPYPTEDEKRTLAAQTNLTLLQVNNWFINARRRILQPMLDASNPNANVAKSKKNKQQTTRPGTTERFWPHTNSDEGSPPLVEEGDLHPGTMIASASVTMESS
ncbi:homeobox protein PKNOX2-like isoform X1 [Styela clava]|uniref:homeobox protein PKNOX2-like isoform X1 n=1 Tax=Styela clava TaxID=7725 RepID=UPI0019394CFA|nr:homeobox protein PKNOX2-like isoform X1 [Styela clava]